MHHVPLSDETFAKAERAAAAGGFESVEDFIERIVAFHLGDGFNEEVRFTPEMIRALDDAAAEARTGNNLSVAEVRAHFSAKRKAWPSDRQH